MPTYNIVLLAGHSDQVSMARLWANFVTPETEPLVVLSIFKFVFTRVLQLTEPDVILGPDDHAANFMDLLYNGLSNTHIGLRGYLSEAGIEIPGEVLAGPVIEVTGFDRYLLGEPHLADIKSYRIEVPTVSTHRFANLS